MNQTAPPTLPQAPRTCGLSIWSLVLGLAGLVLCLGPLAAIPAVICGHIAMSRINKSGGALGGHGMALAGTIMGYVFTAMSVFMVPLLAGMLLPAVAASREQARRIGCMNNLSQIGKASLMYSMDHQDAFPPDLTTLARETHLPPTLFICKSSGNKPGNMANVDAWSDYVLVPGLSGASPADSVLAYCRPGNHGQAGGNVVYVDGSVVWLNQQELMKVIATLPKRGP